MNIRRKPHWYKLFDGECPACGRDQSYRVRMYGKRPRRRKDRIVYLTPVQSYDGCIRV